MPYQYFTYRNNAITTLAGGLSDIGEILIVKSGTGALYPSEYPYLLVLENLVNSVVLKREIVKVIRRDGDTFKIERSAGYCMASDTSLTKTNTAFEFSTDDRVSLRFLEEEMADMNAELVRLGAIELVDATDTQKGTPKLTTAPASPTNPLAVSQLDTRLPTQAENDAMVGTSGTPGTGNEFVTATDPSILNNVALTGNQTVGGIKTFSSIPLLPSTLATGANELVSKAYIDWFSPTATTDVSTGVWYNNLSSGLTYGYRFQAKKDIKIMSVSFSDTLLGAVIKNDAGTVLSTASVSGTTISFSYDVIIPSGTYFRIEAYPNFSNFHREMTAVWFSGVNVDYISGSANGANDTTKAWNIISITTASIT